MTAFKLLFMFISAGILIVSIPTEACFLSFQIPETLGVGNSEWQRGLGIGYSKRMGVPNQLWFLKFSYHRGIKPNMDFGLNFYPYPFGASGELKYQVSSWLTLNGKGGWMRLPFLTCDGIFKVFRDVKTEYKFYPGLRIVLPGCYIGPFVAFKLKGLMCEGAILTAPLEKRSYLFAFGITVRTGKFWLRTKWKK